MYRAITWEVLRRGIDLADEVAVAECARETAPQLEWSVDPTRPSMLVAGTDVTSAIRESNVTAAVSAVSAVPATRAALVERQREAVASAVAHDRGVVMEGRDIGTVVYPRAQVKIYLTASLEERAKRRFIELEQKGGGAVITEVRQQMASRDHRDITRDDSPLTVAEGAHVVETAGLTPEQVVERILGFVPKS